MRSCNAQALAQPDSGVRGWHNVELDVLPALPDRVRLDQEAVQLDRPPVRRGCLPSVGSDDRESCWPAPHAVSPGQCVPPRAQHAEQGATLLLPGPGQRHLKRQRLDHLLRHGAAQEDLGLSFDRGGALKCREGLGGTALALTVLHAERSACLVHPTLAQRERQCERDH